MSDLVELLNDLNQSNRIEYSDYSQLMFCVQQLEEQTQNLAKRICELQSDLAREKSKNEKTIEELKVE